MTILTNEQFSTLNTLKVFRPFLDIAAAKRYEGFFKAFNTEFINCIEDANLDYPRYLTGAELRAKRKAKKENKALLNAQASVLLSILKPFCTAAMFKQVKTLYKCLIDSY